MYTNHHAARLASLQRGGARLRQEILDARAHLDWFEAFDSERAHSTLMQLRRDVHAIQTQLNEADRAVGVNAAQLSKARNAAEPGFFGRFYMTSERSVAILHVTTLEQRVNELRKEKARLSLELAQKEPDEKGLVAELERYRGFDSLGAKAALMHKTLMLEQIHAGVEQALKASARWEEAVGDLAKAYDALIQDIRAIESDLIIAGTLYKDLDTAKTARDKSRVHKDCAAHFGPGNDSPGAVLRERRGARGKLMRDAEKMEHRLREKISVLEKEIAKFVLDGSNLCYAKTDNGDRRFVGLGPLMALVPCLCESYTVELWFDPGIVRQTNMEESELRALFPGVNLNVMRGEHKADAAILGSAEHDEHAYIISNDLFVDFFDKNAVKNKRIFEHIIHPKSIQIMALDLNVAYQQEVMPA